MRIRTTFFIFLCIAVAGVFGWYFLYNQIIANAVAANKITIKRQEAQLAQKQDQSLAAFLATSSRTATTLLESVVPASGSVPFISMVEGLAKEASIGLKVQNVGIASAATVAPSASTKNFDALSLSLSVQGSWADIHTFLDMLETLPYKVRLDKISLTQAVYTAPTTGHTNTPLQSFWSGSLSLSALKIVSPGDLQN